VGRFRAWSKVLGLIIRTFSCFVCAWEGTEDELVELAGSIWDYTEHYACPNCWYNYGEDNTKFYIEEKYYEDK
jgi:hypothetical protein